MDDFRKQIIEDIENYQMKYPHIPKIDKEEWAFNFWILARFFSIEEELIQENITEYSDFGTDCFVWHEELKDLYLIQNKFYRDESKITKEYIIDNFLARTINALKENIYSRSEKLQAIYNKFSMDPDFTIHYQLYVTNNSCKTKSIEDAIKNYNNNNAESGVDCQLFSLDDIENKYYQDPIRDKKDFKYTIKTTNKGTILNINKSDYGLDLPLDARFVFTPVFDVYQLVKKAEKEKYSIFDKNIREYLGTTGNVNKSIVKTLKSETDRNNFFFYNNGITMVVSKMGPYANEFEVTMPQIVNGCQTVSTIYEVLSSLPENILEEKFKNTYVMIKILLIPERENHFELYEDIVKFNNSQNAIKEKTFVANREVYRRLQHNFAEHGFLICIKQSDKYKFKKEGNVSDLLENNSKWTEKFGLEFNKVKRDSFIFDLEKVLQVFLAFIGTPQEATQKKSALLKDNTEENRRATEFYKNNSSITTNDYLNLFLFYLKSEQKKANNKELKVSSYYMVHCLSKYECNGDGSKISLILSNKETIDRITVKYMKILARYHRKWTKINAGKEYNDMIKAVVNYELLEELIEDYETDEDLSI